MNKMKGRFNDDLAEVHLKVHLLDPNPNSDDGKDSSLYVRQDKSAMSITSSSKSDEFERDNDYRTIDNANTPLIRLNDDLISNNQDLNDEETFNRVFKTHKVRILDFE